MLELLLPRSIMHTLQLFLVVYTGMQAWMSYFPGLGLADIHECLLHVDKARCGDPFEDWFKGSSQLDESKLLQISEMTGRTLLKKYAD